MGLRRRMISSGSGKPPSVEGSYKTTENDDGVVTKELFPMSARSWQGQPSMSSFPARKSLIDLSLDQHHGESGEMKNMVQLQQQQQQQQVKKSRRGPRSRSSSYRGVTFYRRTRRWELHICVGIAGNKSIWSL